MEVEPRARKKPVKPVGFGAVPTLVIDADILLGFEVNRYRIECRIP